MLVMDYLLVYEMYKRLFRESIVEPLTHIRHARGRSRGTPKAATYVIARIGRAGVEPGFHGGRLSRVLLVEVSVGRDREERRGIGVVLLLHVLLLVEEHRIVKVLALTVHRVAARGTALHLRLHQKQGVSIETVALERLLALTVLRDEAIPSLLKDYNGLGVVVELTMVISIVGLEGVTGDIAR